MGISKYALLAIYMYLKQCTDSNVICVNVIMLIRMQDTVQTLSGRMHNVKVKSRVINMYSTCQKKLDILL